MRSPVRKYVENDLLIELENVSLIATAFLSPRMVVTVKLDLGFCLRAGFADDLIGILLDHAVPNIKLI